MISSSSISWNIMISYSSISWNIMITYSSISWNIMVKALYNTHKKNLTFEYILILNIFKIKCRGKKLNILIAVLHISGLLIYLKLKIKSSFLRIFKKKTYYSTMIFGYIFINRKFNPFISEHLSSFLFV